MGNWMNKQFWFPETDSLSKLEAVDNNSDPGSAPLANGNVDEFSEVSDSHSEASDISEVSTIEQRRAYKLELQVQFHK